MSNYKKLLDLAKEEKRARIHSFHRYFGKLIPAIPRFAIREFSDKDDIVLDPFCGSGTTLVESSLSDRNSFGIDLNPLSCLISNAKVNYLKEDRLMNEKKRLLEMIGSDSGKNYEKNTPFCINLEHWFKPFVIKEATIIKRNIDKLSSGKVKNFFLACFSAMLRDISNADPRHIFPGYSKRLRELDKNGERDINVYKKFDTVTEQRIQFLQELSNNGVSSKAIIGDARSMPSEIKNIKLIVTNPPYISSIRYLETAKLEMYWLGFVKEREEYLSLDKKVIGTERLGVKEYDSVHLTGYKNIDKTIRQIYNTGNFKMSKVVARYFEDMNKVFKEMHRVLLPHGYVVIKISDSLVRKVRVPTHEFFIEIAGKNGLKKIDAFKDEIENRSLLTKRNYYSGMLSHDWILIFQKV